MHFGKCFNREVSIVLSYKRAVILQGFYNEIALPYFHSILSQVPSHRKELSIEPILTFKIHIVLLFQADFSFPKSFATKSRKIGHVTSVIQIIRSNVRSAEKIISNFILTAYGIRNSHIHSTEFSLIKIN